MSDSDSRGSILVDVAALSALRESRSVVVLDVRLGPAESVREAYRQAHVPGAVATSVARDFAGPETDETGTLPLPAIASLQAALARWGVGRDTTVVVYSDKPATAARAWWVLRWAGVASVRLLDGGLRAWIAAGRPVEAGDPPATVPAVTSPLALSAGHLPTLDYDALPDFVAGGLLIDTRLPAGFGTAEAPTHIPGAINAPARETWDADEKLLGTAALRAHFDSIGALGGGAVGAYCGGGVLAAYEVLALKAIGVDAALYVGSWSEWSKRQRASAPVR